MSRGGDQNNNNNTNNKIIILCLRRAELHDRDGEKSFKTRNTHTSARPLVIIQ
jgi:hypothetical protein